MHSEHGTVKGTGMLSNTVFINASTSGEDYKKRHDPIVIDL